LVRCYFLLFAASSQSQCSISRCPTISQIGRQEHLCWKGRLSFVLFATTDESVLEAMATTLLLPWPSSTSLLRHNLTSILKNLHGRRSWSAVTDSALKVQLVLSTTPAHQVRFSGSNWSLDFLVRRSLCRIGKRFYFQALD
jgi:hypothetical protein